MSRPTIVDGAVISFLNYRTGTALDLAGNGQRQNGTHVVAYQFHGRQNQQWKLEQFSDDPLWPTWMIRNMSSGTYLDLPYGRPVNGTKIQGWQKRGKPSQLWRLVSADPSGRVFMLQNVGSGTYLDLMGGNSANMTEITGWAGAVETGNQNQVWRVVRMN